MDYCKIALSWKIHLAGSIQHLKRCKGWKANCVKVLSTCMPRAFRAVLWSQKSQFLFSKNIMTFSVTTVNSVYNLSELCNPLCNYFRTPDCFVGERESARAGTIYFGSGVGDGLFHVKMISLCDLLSLVFLPNPIPISQIQNSIRCLWVTSQDGTPHRGTGWTSSWS